MFVRKKRNNISRELDEVQELVEQEADIPPEERHLSLNTIVGRHRKMQRFAKDTKAASRRLKRNKAVAVMNDECPFDMGTDDWFDWMLHDLTANSKNRHLNPRKHYLSKKGWEDMQLVKQSLQPMFELAFMGYGLNEICIEMGLLKSQLEKMALENPFLAKSLLMIQSVSKAWWEKQARINLTNKDFQTNLWKANMQFQFDVEQSPKRDAKETKVRDVYNNINVNNNGEKAVSQIDLGMLDDEALDNLIDCFESIEEELVVENQEPALLEA